VNVLLDPAARLVIGHRGDAAHAPENTIPSFEQALALGADALEFDVRVSRDDVPVVIHDASLARTTGTPALVGELPLTEIARADAGALFTSDGGLSFPFRDRGVGIPTLELVLERFRGVPKIIEVKVPEAVGATRRAIRAAGALDEVLIDSSIDAAVLPFRDGSVATGPSLREVVRLLPRTLLPGGATRLPYDAICIPLSYNGYPVPVRRLARVVRRAGVTTHVWTINDPRVAVRLWRAGVQGIITDDPAVMIRARAESFQDR
jgi:glycerophosphoryl diester phosphodiesterase